MKIWKFIRIVLIIIIIIILASILGLLIWSRTGTYPARSAAIAALESTGTVSISQDEWIVFSPDEKTDTGLIFYPGGLVEPGAYAPVLHQIADEGFEVIIVPMPLNLAIFNTGAGNAVIEAYPQIDTWILAGHSLGGAAASIYAENYANKIDAIVFWDSYPAKSADLSDNGIKTLSIFGTTNGVPNTENFDAQKYLLPGDARYESIEGASHAQFGDYGPQKGDVMPAISLSEQHTKVSGIMLDFINSFANK